MDPILASAHVHANGTGTMSRQQKEKPQLPLSLMPSKDSNDSDSWLESSRSRETSPDSSIPPGMAPFRVIPLHAESESRSISADPSGNGFTTLTGGPFRQQPDLNGGGDMNGYPRSTSVAGSNPSDHWAEVNGHPYAGGDSGPQPPPADGTPTSSGSTQPLLRRNQYWV